MGQKTTMNDAVLGDITGVGVTTARTLVEHGFADVRSVAAAGVADLAHVPGFGPVRATAVKAAAEALNGTRPDADDAMSPSEKDREPKKSKKNKKAKKAKRNNDKVANENKKTKKKKKSKKNKKAKRNRP
jgi:hypothetical protein